MSFTIVVFILILAIAGVVLFLRLNKNPEALKSMPEKRLTTLDKRKLSNTAELNKIRHSEQFWGVSIEPDTRAKYCQAVLDLKGQQFTLDDVPNLPLIACNKPLCLCHYVGLKEKRHGCRRQGFDRRDEVRFDPNGSDRRNGKDRRKAGHDIWFKHDVDG